MTIRSALLGVCLCLTGAMTASATFTLVEDFDSLSPGDIGGQGAWLSSSATAAIVDADPSNSVNRVLHRVGPGGVSNTNAAISIPDGAGGTFFFRIRYDGTGQDEVFGLSDQSPPNIAGDFSTFEVQAGILGDNGLRVRDAGANETPSTLINTNAWYNVWMAVNNSADTWGFYVQSDDDADFTTQTQILSADGTINFRNGTTDALVSFLSKGTNAGATSSVYIDDLYIDPVAINLTDPHAGVVVIPGDVDGDGDVDLVELDNDMISDFDIIRDHFQQMVSTRAEGDLVFSGKVDFADFRAWKTAFLGGGGSLEGVNLSFLAGVPEPSTLGLALLAANVLGLRAGRRRAV